MAMSEALRKAVATYVEERKSEEIAGFECEVFPHLTRHTPRAEGMDGIVLFAQLPPDDAARLIRVEIDYFAERKLDFEWKVYDFDLPHDLRSRLQEHGFACGESEAFMLFQTEPKGAGNPVRSEAQIRRVESQTGVDDIVRVQEVVWQENFDWLRRQISETITNRPQELSLYCAYVDDVPVGSGWTSFAPGSQFPELHGGAVVPEWRGKSIYGDLYRVRCDEVATRGFHWTAVDATPMSRPILEKLGFQYVCMTHPMTYPSSKVGVGEA